MTTTNTQDANSTATKAKQPTPCERATSSTVRAKAALKLATKLAGKEPDQQTQELLAEVESHEASTGRAAAIACNEEVPYARRLTASGRAKLAADSAEGAAGEIKATQDRVAAEADDTLLAELENVPGYTKNPEWLAVQERIAARRF